MFVDETLEALRKGVLEGRTPSTARPAEIAANIMDICKRRVPDSSGEAERSAVLAATRDLIMQSSVYVFEPSAIDTVSGLAEKRLLAAQQEYLRLPGQLVWLEWAGVHPGIFGPHSDRRGMIFWAEPNDDEQWMPGVPPTRGCITIFQRDPRVLPDGSRRNHISTIGFDFARPNGILFPFRSRTALGSDTGLTLEEQLARLGRWLSAALILRNTPRVIEARPAELERLNRARAKKQRAPLLPYTQIFVPLVAAAARKSGGGGGGEGTDAASSWRRQHHVDTFFRLRRGQVELVKPHWRGDPALGTVKTVHRMV